MSTTQRPPLRSRLVGLLALLALLTLLVGIPAALLAVAGNPLPSALPGWADLTTALLSPDDGGLFLGLLLFAGWAGWAGFALSVLVEVLARLRGRPVPHLPALQLQQRAAAGLVGAAALLFTASPVGAVAAAADTAAPHAPLVSVSTTQHPPAAAPAPDRSTIHSSAPADAAAAPGHGRAVVVEEGDSLWSIAERELGNGERFTEIATLNYGRRQPDGGALGRSHWIRPGWTLTLPATAAAAATPSKDSRGDGSYTVRRGDTLAEIAADTLGDPDRFPEIARASAGITQPGGARLSDPDVIDVGWTLRIPKDRPDSLTAEPPTAAAPTRPDAETPPADQPRPGPSSPQAVSAPTTSSAPAGAAPTTSSAPGVNGATPNASSAPGAATPEQAARPPGAPNTTVQAVPSVVLSSPDADRALDDADEDFPVRTAAGVGALLAAGVLGLLAARRTNQQRHRRPGHPVPLPTGDAAHLEHELRATADPLSVATVDLALRTLAHGCAQHGQPLPVVRAARLTGEQFDLYLAEPADLPAPWAGTADAAVWTLPAGAAELLDVDQAAQVPAPFPSLVTVGHDAEDGHVFVDLEHLGALAVTGRPTQTREVLAAVAVELATSRWADDLQVIIVGAYPELQDALQTGRIRYLPAVGHLIDELTVRAEHDREVLARADAPDLNHARADGAAPAAWTPEIVLLAGDLTDRQRAQLQQLLEQLPRVAMAAVTGSGRPMGEWSIQLEDGDTALLQPVGLRIRPQRIDDHAYAQILDVLATATDTTGEAGEDDEPQLAGLPAPVDEPPIAIAEQIPVTITVGDVGAASPAALGSIPYISPQPVRHRPVEPEPDAGPEQEPDAAGDDRRTHLKAQRRARLAALRAGSHRLDTKDGAPAQPDASDGQDAPPLVGGATRLVVPPAADTSDADAPPASADESDQLRDGAPTSLQSAAAAKHDHQDADSDQVAPAADDGPGPAALEPPRVLVLGSVEITGAHGQVEPSKRNRLTELAAYLALHPGVDHAAIDAALSPGARVGANARNTAMSKLRRWLGKDDTGADHLPRYQADTRYQLSDQVTTDWQTWQQLLPDGPQRAPSQALEQALRLVRGRPFDGVGTRRYAWAEHLKQVMISAIVDAAYELARRRLMEGRWRSAEQAVVIGLTVEPGMERLWRIRLLAARSSGNRAAERDTIDRLLAVADDLGGDLEDETERLLAQLRDDTNTPLRDELVAHAL